MPTERQLNIILESELEFKTFKQEPMSNKADTQLPAEVDKLNILKKHYYDYYRPSFPSDKRTAEVVNQALCIKEETEAIFKAMDDYATAYAIKLKEAQQEIESLTNQLKKQNEVQVEKIRTLREEHEKASNLLNEVLVMNEMWGDLPGEFITKVKTFLDGAK